MYHFDSPEIRQERKNTIDKVFELTHNPNAWEEINDIINTTKKEIIDDFNKSVLRDICYVRMIIYNRDRFNTEDDLSIFNEKIAFLKQTANNVGIYFQLYEIAKYLIKHYGKRKRGRPKGKGKRTFVYNDKTYTTIQSCANDYKISKQAMHKRLKKANII